MHVLVHIGFQVFIKRMYAAASCTGKQHIQWCSIDVIDSSFYSKYDYTDAVFVYCLGFMPRYRSSTRTNDRHHGHHGHSPLSVAILARDSRSPRGRHLACGLRCIGSQCLFRLRFSEANDRPMVTQLNSDPYVIPVQLFGIHQLAVHHRYDCEVGRSIYVEQSHLLQALGITDGSDFRKHEKQRGNLHGIVEDWSLA